MTTDKARYNFYPSGTFSIIEGRLGSEPEVKTLDSGKRLVKLNIATNAGSKKKDDGSYENLTEWQSVTIWDNGGESTLLIDTILTPPSDKLIFGKGHSVILHAFIESKLRIYNDKPFRDVSVTQFHHLYKVIGQKSNQVDENNTNDGSNSQKRAEEIGANEAEETIPF